MTEIDLTPSPDDRLILWEHTIDGRYGNEDVYAIEDPGRLSIEDAVAVLRLCTDPEGFRGTLRRGDLVGVDPGDVLGHVTPMVTWTDGAIGWLRKFPPTALSMIARALLGRRPHYVLASRQSCARESEWGQRYVRRIDESLDALRSLGVPFEGP